MQDGQTIFAHNAATQLSPASITKLLLAGTALAKFSPNYQFDTIFYTDGPLKAGQINGNLYVKGAGDPMLVNEILWQIAADLKHLGVKQITGQLVIDDSVFDGKKL